MEIGLTRLTSTPLSPTRSRAEACQPLRVIFAARQRHDHVAATGDEGRGDRAPTPSLYRKKTIKILLLSLIGTFRKTGEPIHNQPLFYWLAFSETNHTRDLDVQQKSPGGVDMPQPYSRKGLRGWMTNVSTRFL